MAYRKRYSRPGVSTKVKDTEVIGKTNDGIDIIAAIFNDPTGPDTVTEVIKTESYTTMTTGEGSSRPRPSKASSGPWHTSVDRKCISSRDQQRPAGRFSKPYYTSRETRWSDPKFDFSTCHDHAAFEESAGHTDHGFDSCVASDGHANDSANKADSENAFELIRLVEEAATWRKKYEELQVEYDKLKEDKDQEFNALKEDFEKQIDTLKAENTNLSQQYSNAQLEVQKMEELQTRLEELEGLRQRSDDQQTRYEQIKAEVERLKAELDKISNLYDDRVRENDKIRRETVPKSREKELNDEIDSLMRSVERYRARIIQMESDTTAKDKEAELTAEIDRLRLSLRDKTRDLDELVEEHRRLDEEKHNKLSKLKEDLIEKESEIEALKAKLEDEAAKAKQNASCKCECKTTCQCGQRCCDSGNLTVLLREKESHIHDLQHQVENLRVTVSDYQQEISRLRARSALPTSAERAPREHTRTMSMKGEGSSKPHTKCTHSCRQHKLISCDMTSDTDDQKPCQATNHRPGYSGDQDLEAKLARTQNQLRASSDRVKQLESWLDEIYAESDSDGIRNTRRPEIVGKGIQFDTNRPAYRSAKYKTLHDKKILDLRKRNEL